MAFFGEAVPHSHSKNTSRIRYTRTQHMKYTSIHELFIARVRPISCIFHPYIERPSSAAAGFVHRTSTQHTKNTTQHTTISKNPEQGPIVYNAVECAQVVQTIHTFISVGIFSIAVVAYNSQILNVSGFATEFCCYFFSAFILLFRSHFSLTFVCFVFFPGELFVFVVHCRGVFSNHSFFARIIHMESGILLDFFLVVVVVAFRSWCNFEFV